MSWVPVSVGFLKGTVPSVSVWAFSFGWGRTRFTGGDPEVLCGGLWVEPPWTS